jgi:hypothetical protein
MFFNFFFQNNFIYINIVGFKLKYLKDHEFRVGCKRFGTLAFLSLDNIEDAWNIILDSIPCELCQELLTFKTYFVKTWLKCKNFMKSLNLILKT